MRVLMRAAALGVCCAGAVSAQQPPRAACLTNEALRHYRVAQSPVLSPDGQRVAFVIREGAAHKGDSHLWWADTRAPERARQITYSESEDDAGESDPQWLSDGSAVLFLAHRDTHRRIFRLPTDGGEASPLDIEYPGGSPDSATHAGASDSIPPAGGGATDRQVEVSSFAVSPDGRWIAVLARDAESAAERRRKTQRNDAQVVDHDLHPQRAWLYSLGDRTLAPVSDTVRQALSVSWSHDSQRLAVVTRPAGNSDDLGPQHTVEIIEVTAPGVARRIAGVPPTVDRVVWSPDGAQFAFVAQTTHDAPPGVSDLFVMPSAGGAARDVTAAGSVEVSGSDLEWASDGAAVYVPVRQGTTVGLARVDVASGRARRLATGFAVTGAFSTNAAHTGWAYIGQASDRPPEVEYAAGFATPSAPVRLTRVNPQLPDTGWGAVRPATWKSPDGLVVHGLLFVPPVDGCSGNPRDARFPLIVNVHGGPTGAFSEGFSPFVQWQLAQGWAVLEPNPRGSTGYGWQFAAANKNDLGGKDYEDVMGGVDWALAHESIDSARLGLYGYSYGGEMAGFVEGRTTRFAAIVSGAPVIDQYSEYGTEGGSWYDRWFFGQPWRRPADAWRQSPLARAGEAKTPFLLLQGETDTTDPLGQSQEMYRALRQEAVPVQLVQFPRESHGGLGGAIAGNPSREPWHGFDGRQHILAWFTSHFEKR
jgi:dipeptidyl aminopeptidase/acylaminoacyl peptidase